MTKVVSRVFKDFEKFGLLSIQGEREICTLKERFTLKNLIFLMQFQSLYFSSLHDIFNQG